MRATTFTAALVAAIQTDGRSLGELENAAGTSKAALSRLLRGKRSITLTSADRVLSALGYDVQLIKRRRKTTR
jgi:transcriptional regulator with XRE-family HTH domain